MRAMWALTLALTTSCSSLLADRRPGPQCRETEGVVADQLTSVVSAFVAVPLLLASAECLSRDCGEDASVVHGSLAVVSFTGALFAVSARYGARQNAACRRARMVAWPGE